MTLKLGKRPKREDPRTLKLGRYLMLPPPKTSTDWSLGVYASWGMDGNDQYGDCAWAMMAHYIMQITANAGAMVTPTTVDVLNAYASTGFDPATGSHDDGTVMLDCMNYMRKTGMCGHQIGAFAEVDPKNHDEVRVALDLFPGLLIGVTVPEEWEKTKLWDISNSSIAGGHAILGSAHGVTLFPNKDGIRIVSWGDDGYLLTWDALDAYCDEMYVSLPQAWIADNGLAPNGLNMAVLANDLTLVTA